MESCRSSRDAFHVCYSVKTDDDGGAAEAVNLTHAGVIDTEEIEEREEVEYGWVTQFTHDRARLLAGTDESGGWDVDHLLTAGTCEQLADMFAQAAVTLRANEERARAEAEERARQDAAEKARQMELPATI